MIWFSTLYHRWSVTIQWFLCFSKYILTWFNVTELICIHNTAGNQHYWLFNTLYLLLTIFKYHDTAKYRHQTFTSNTFLYWVSNQRFKEQLKSHRCHPFSVYHVTHVHFRMKLIEGHESTIHSWGGNHYIPCETSGTYFPCKTLDIQNQNNTNWTLKRSMIVV